MLGRFWIDLGSISGRFGIVLGSVWGRFGVGLGSIWDQFGVDSGSVRGRFGVGLSTFGGMLANLPKSWSGKALSGKVAPYMDCGPLHFHTCLGFLPTLSGGVDLGSIWYQFVFVFI